MNAQELKPALKMDVVLDRLQNNIIANRDSIWELQKQALTGISGLKFEWKPIHS